MQPNITEYSEKKNKILEARSAKENLVFYRRICSNIRLHPFPPTRYFALCPASKRTTSVDLGSHIYNLIKKLKIMGFKKKKISHDIVPTTLKKKKNLKI